MIKHKKREMTEAEYKYTFCQNESWKEDSAGLIGVLRADMDTDGNGFFSSWNDWRKDLKTDEFKAEFDEVINSLREEGDILHNRKTLANYCYSNPHSKMQNEQDYYGVRVDTEKYAYLLRLNPTKGEYNLYCYCYVREWLDNLMRNRGELAMERNCLNCKHYSAFQEPRECKGGFTIYGYCFKGGTSEHDVNMGKGFPVYIAEAGCKSHVFMKGKKR